MVILCSIFWIWTTILFSTVAAAPFCIPTSKAQGFKFLYILTNTCYFLAFCFCFCFFNQSYPKVYEVVFHGFDLYFCNDGWCWASFHVFIDHMYTLEKCLLESCAHLKLGCLLLLSLDFCLISMIMSTHACGDGGGVCGGQQYAACFSRKTWGFGSKCQLYSSLVI